MAARKKKQAKSGRGRWVSFGILAVLLAAVAVGIALNLPVHPRPVSAPVPPPQPALTQRQIALGSYGVTLTDHTGKTQALTIHPVAILRGGGPWKGLQANQDQLDARIANPFMAFPDLARITTSAAAKAALERQILQNIAPLLSKAEPGWKIVGIRLRPTLRSPPPADS